MLILDGRRVAQLWQTAIGQRTQRLIATGRPPGLAVLLVGSDPASLLYTSMKERASQKLGFISYKTHLKNAATTADVIAALEEFNQEPTIDGILIQLPLPDQIDTAAVLERLNPAKDVDGLHPHSLGNLLIGQERLLPATPKGILHLLEYYQIPTEGSHVVIVGRSAILGKPLAALFLNRNATVTVCHSKTANLGTFTEKADILVMDTGVPGLLTADMVTDQVVIIDAGITQLLNGQVVGDVDFATVAPKVRAITPVPGGVGPVTIAALLDSTVSLAESAILKSYS